MLNQLFIMCLCCTFLYSCSSGPSDQEVLKLATPPGLAFVLKLEVQKHGKSQKIGDTKVYSFTVFSKYIQSGMTFGYEPECPEAQCHKDIEYEKVNEYLIGKNKWNEWEIFESRNKEQKEIQRYWRPTSKTLEEFYKDKK